MEQTIKGYRGIGMNGWLARWYAKNTGKDNAQQELARTLAAQLDAGSKVLEVAPGPGYLSVALAKSGRVDVTALEISPSFVEIVRKNAADAGISIDVRQGNASAMPFSGDSFDFVVCRAAFKNFSEPVKALVEMHRVLKPGGRALVIDLQKDASIAEIDHYIEHAGVGFFSAVMMKWTFRHMLLKRAYTRRQFEEFISRTPFERSEVRAEGIGFEISLWK